MPKNSVRALCDIAIPTAQALSKRRFPETRKSRGRFSNNPSSKANPCVYTVYMTIHSWITISLADPRALYLQVIEQIKRRVAVGDLPPGAELPSIRQLAAELKISVITIKRAYLELEREGVILTRQGKGSVVAERPGLQASIQEREMNEHLQEAVQLGLLLGKSKTEMQKRIAECYERKQKGMP